MLRSPLIRRLEHRMGVLLDVIGWLTTAALALAVVLAVATVVRRPPKAKRQPPQTTTLTDLVE